jgi:hypothetical protein
VRLQRLAGLRPVRRTTPPDHADHSAQTHREQSRSTRNSSFLVVPYDYRCTEVAAVSRVSPLATSPTQAQSTADPIFLLLSCQLNSRAAEISPRDPSRRVELAILPVSVLWMSSSHTLCTLSQANPIHCSQLFLFSPAPPHSHSASVAQCDGHANGDQRASATAVPAR